MIPRHRRHRLLVRDHDEPLQPFAADEQPPEAKSYIDSWSPLNQIAQTKKFGASAVLLIQTFHQSQMHADLGREFAALIELIELLQPTERQTEC